MSPGLPSRPTTALYLPHIAWPPPGSWSLMLPQVALCTPPALLAASTTHRRWPPGAVYCLQAGTWSMPEVAGTDQPPPRHSHSLSAHNGTLVLLGGTSGTSVLGDMWWYTIDTATWAQVSPACPQSAPSCLGTPRITGHTASVVGDRLIVLGGRSPEQEFQTQVGKRSPPAFVPVCMHHDASLGVPSIFAPLASLRPPLQPQPTAHRGPDSWTLRQADLRV